MHTKRIIPCLDVTGGRVVKGINFVNLRDAGDPVEVGAAYDAAGADELVFLDITASSDARDTQLEWVRQVASKVFIPFTVGGGIRTVEDFKRLLREGAVISKNTTSSAPALSYAAAISAGSPASRKFTKLTPFTTRPSFTSKQGMILFVNILLVLLGNLQKVI